MKLLADFVDRHPLSAGAIGTGSGIFSGVADRIHFLAGLAADLAALLGFGIALLTCLLLFRRWREHRPLTAVNRYEADEDDDLP